MLSYCASFPNPQFWNEGRWFLFNVLACGSGAFFRSVGACCVVGHGPRAARVPRCALGYILVGFR
jgi:hypothetical protein